MIILSLSYASTYLRNVLFRADNSLLAIRVKPKLSATRTVINLPTTPEIIVPSQNFTLQILCNAGPYELRAILLVG
jgi:hypothetical protein